MSRQQSRIKKTKSTNSRNKIAFCSKYNLLGPNIKSIIQKHAHSLDNCQVMQNKEIIVACKFEKQLKESLTRADPYNIKMLMIKCTRMFLASKVVIYVQTL